MFKLRFISMFFHVKYWNLANPHLNMNALTKIIITYNNDNYTFNANGQKGFIVIPLMDILVEACQIK